MVVGLEEVKRTDAPALILARLLQSSGEFAEAGAVVHRTEGIPITLIGFLRNFSAPVHVGHAAPHSAPLQVVLRAAFCGPVGFEHFYVLGEGLFAKQVEASKTSLSPEGGPEDD